MSVSTAPAVRRRRRDRIAWYPYVEAVWGFLALLIAVFPGLAFPGGVASPLLLAVVIPLPFFLVVRVVSTVVDLRAGE